MRYNGRPAEVVKIIWRPIEQCPVVGEYIIRVIDTLELRTSEGERVELLEGKS